MADRIFWRSMTYGCDSGNPNHELVFLLEEGCEGPRAKSVPAFLAKDHPFNPGGEIRLDFTADGRAVLPVPFIAGPCPKCKADPCEDCRSIRTGKFGREDGPRPCYLSHVRWSEDQQLEPPIVGAPEGPVFRYPDEKEREKMGDQACGVPVYAGR